MYKNLINLLTQRSKILWIRRIFQLIEDYHVKYQKIVLIARAPVRLSAYLRKWLLSIIQHSCDHSRPLESTTSPTHWISLNVTFLMQSCDADACLSYWPAHFFSVNCLPLNLFIAIVILNIIVIR